MAETGYGCVFGDCTSPIDHILTTLSTGASVSLCAEHYAPGMIPLLAAELGVDPGDFYANVERYLAREAKKADKAVADAQAAQAAKGSKGPEAGADPGDAVDTTAAEQAVAEVIAADDAEGIQR